VRRLLQVGRAVPVRQQRATVSVLPAQGQRVQPHCDRQRAGGQRQAAAGLAELSRRARKPLRSSRARPVQGTSCTGVVAVRRLHLAVQSPRCAALGSRRRVDGAPGPGLAPARPAETARRRAVSRTHHARPGRQYGSVRTGSWVRASGHWHQNSAGVALATPAAPVSPARKVVWPGQTSSNGVSMPTVPRSTLLAPSCSTWPSRNWSGPSGRQLDMLGPQPDSVAAGG